MHALTFEITCSISPITHNSLRKQIGRHNWKFWFSIFSLVIKWAAFPNKVFCMHIIKKQAHNTFKKLNYLSTMLKVGLSLLLRTNHINSLNSFKTNQTLSRKSLGLIRNYIQKHLRMFNFIIFRIGNRKDQNSAYHQSIMKGSCTTK